MRPCRVCTRSTDHFAYAAGASIGLVGAHRGAPSLRSPVWLVLLEPGPRVRHDLVMTSAAAHAEPFRAVLDGAALDDLARRLRTTRMPAGTDDTWERGVPGGWLAELIAAWRAFDPLALQARLDQLTHLRVEAGGVTVHVVHAPGTGPKAALDRGAAEATRRLTGISPGDEGQQSGKPA